MFNHNENFTVFESNTTEAVVQAQGQVNEIREEEDLDNEIIEEDIELFKQNGSLEEAFPLSQEGETQHVSKTCSFKMLMRLINFTINKL